jgi:precorrin-6Y C5,15-methyltransferase (decarboxylating)
LLILSHGSGTPMEVAKTLTALGYGPSRMIVLERMGHAEERQLAATAAEWKIDRTEDLNTIAIECIAGPDAVARPRVPGLPDDTFRHDGQLTKREVRAATIAALAPLPGQLLWDVGAGCGSVAIEWLRCHRSLRASAIEREAARAAMILENAATLGVPQLDLVEGSAPEALADLPAPDAVFIGGGLTVPGLVERCWSALNPRGRLVANAVTVEGEARLIVLRGELGGELMRIAVSRAEPVGPFTGWRPLMPVTQLVAMKR